jgi:hypothetical protein
MRILRLIKFKLYESNNRTWKENCRERLYSSRQAISSESLEILNVPVWFYFLKTLRVPNSEQRAFYKDFNTGIG